MRPGDNVMTHHNNGSGLQEITSGSTCSHTGANRVKLLGRYRVKL